MKHGIKVRVDDSKQERLALHEMLDRVLDSLDKAGEDFNAGDLLVTPVHDPMLESTDIQMEWTPRN